MTPRKLLAWLAPLLLLALIFSSVELFGPAWHLLHGNFLDYRGWRIPVPPGFYVTMGSGGPSLVHISVGALLWGGPSADIHFAAFPPGQPFQHATSFNSFAAGASKAASDHGYLPLDRRVVGTGSGTAYCIEFADPAGTKAYIQCAIEESTLFVLYMGSSEYKREFILTLQNMKFHHDAGANP